MNPIVDTIISVLFIAFLFFIIAGIHRNRMLQNEKEDKK